MLLEICEETSRTQLRMGFERFSNFQRTLRRRFRAIEENQCHAIANREPDELAGGFGDAKVVRASNDLSEFLLNLALLVHEQLGVTDHVHE